MEIKGSIDSNIQGAVPAALAQNYEQYLSEQLRSAFPAENNMNSVYYTVTAKKIEDGVETSTEINGTVTQTPTSTDFVLKLTTGIWKIYANGYTDSAHTIKTFSGVQDKYTSVNTTTGVVTVISDITISDGVTGTDGTQNPPPYYNSIAITVTPTMQNDTQAEASAAASGNDVSLTIKSGDVTIQKIVAIWNIGSSTKHQTLTRPASPAEDGSYLFNFTMIDDDDAALATPVTKVPSNTYSVTFYFYSGTQTGGDEYLSYYCTEAINVFDNLTTDTWKSSSLSQRHFLTQSGTTTFKVTSDLVKLHTGTSFWVSSSGTDVTSADYSTLLGAGKPANPFKTVQHAVNVIKSVNETLWDATTGPNREFTIYVKDNLTASDTEVFDSNNKSLINIQLPSSGNVTSLKIKIVSLDQSGSSSSEWPYAIDANRTYTSTNTTGTKGRVLNIDNGVTVTLENIELKGGVLDETAAGGNEKGAGVYVAAGGNLKINGTVKINSNKAFASTGGSSSLSEKASNVYLPLTEGSTPVQKAVTVLGPLTNSSIGITTASVPSTAGANGAVKFTSGYSTTNTQPPASFFTNDNAGFMVGLTAVSGTTTQEASLVMSGGSISTPDTYDDIVFTASSKWFIDTANNIPDNTVGAPSEVSTGNVRWINWENTEVEIKAKAVTNTSGTPSYTDISSSFNWKNFIVKNGTKDITATYNITQVQDSSTNAYSNKITFPEFIQGGDYSLYVRGEYNGKEYGGTIKIVIEDSYCIDIDGTDAFKKFLQQCNKGETYNLRINISQSSPNRNGELKTPLQTYNDVYINLNMTSCRYNYYTLSYCTNLKNVFFNWIYQSGYYPNASTFSHCTNIKLYPMNTYEGCNLTVSDDRKSIITVTP